MFFLIAFLLCSPLLHPCQLIGVHGIAGPRALQLVRSGIFVCASANDLVTDISANPLAKNLRIDLFSSVQSKLYRTYTFSTMPSCLRHSPFRA